MSLREPGITRPDWAPPRSSGLFDTWIIRLFHRGRQPQPTDPPALDIYSPEAIRQRTYDALREYSAALRNDPAEREIYERTLR